MPKRPRYSPANIGPRVRALCAARGWSLSELARRLDVSQPVVMRLVTGGRPDPRCSTLIALAGALGVTPDELLAK
jgi:transcriptional regulator with XRE-family HTH domain